MKSNNKLYIGIFILVILVIAISIFLNVRSKQKDNYLTPTDVGYLTVSNGATINGGAYIDYINSPTITNLQNQINILQNNFNNRFPTDSSVRLGAWDIKGDTSQYGPRFTRSDGGFADFHFNKCDGNICGIQGI